VNTPSLMTRLRELAAVSAPHLRPTVAAPHLRPTVAAPHLRPTVEVDLDRLLHTFNANAFDEGEGSDDPPQ
jgi:hypothetical protein